MCCHRQILAARENGVKYLGERIKLVIVKLWTRTNPRVL